MKTGQSFEVRLVRLTIVLLLLPLLTVTSSAQTLPDSLFKKANRITSESPRALDSVISLASVSRIKDSLTIEAWAEKTRNKISTRFSADIITRSADSLRKLGIPEVKIAHRSDSLLRTKTALLKEVQEKQTRLHKSVMDRYVGWTNSLRKKHNLDSAGVKMPPNLSAPLSPKLPDINMGAIPILPEANLPEMPGLLPNDFAELGMSKELKSVSGELAMPSADQLKLMDTSLPAIGNPMDEVTSKTKELKALTKDPSAAAEKAALQSAEANLAAGQLKDAQNITNANEALKTAEQLKNPESIKEQAANHFTGKEAELRGAMSQMAKYKKKFPSISDLSQIPKNAWLPRNGLKGKPFRERFRPGINLGVRSAGDTALLDFHPNASYRFTGRIEAGLGGIYRLRLATSPLALDQREPVWGFATFIAVKTFKSVFIRFEADGTSHVRHGASDQPTYRDWRWSFYSGIQTNFKVSKRVTGNVQMLYNFDSSLKDGFPEKLTARVGVQYSLKKKKK